MIVEACDKCKKLNTLTKLVYFMKIFKTERASDPLAFDTEGKEVEGFSVALSKFGKSQQFCGKCLGEAVTETLSSLI